MTREGIKDLLISIKSFYPRFSLVDVDANDDYVVRSQTLDAWYGMLGYKNEAECRKILQDHISGPNGDKMPSVSLFTKSGQGRSVYQCNAVLEMRGQDYAVIVHRLESGETLRYKAVRDKTNTWEDEEGRLWAVPEC